MTSSKTLCKGKRAVKSSFCPPYVWLRHQLSVIFFMKCDIFYYMVITRHGIFSDGLSVWVCVHMGAVLALEKGRVTINLTLFWQTEISITRHIMNYIWRDWGFVVDYQLRLHCQSTKCVTGCMHDGVLNVFSSISWESVRLMVPVICVFYVLVCECWPSCKFTVGVCSVIVFLSAMTCAAIFYLYIIDS